MPDSDLGELWQVVLTSLEKRITDQRFNTWFNPLVPKALDDSTLTIQVPNPFFVDWFEEHNLPILRRSIQEALGWIPEIRFIVDENYREHFAAAVVPSSPKTEHPDGSPAEFPASRRRFESSNLNPRFTFSNFVVGRSNELAHAACQAVAKDPGHVYNPLFIYGGVGLGKTHLMQAIGLALCARNSMARIHYVGAETFMNEMIEAIRAGTTIEFREKYRSLDLLLIDDIQFLSGKGRTEEEFFHTFNVLYDANKQVVVNCDRPPSDLVSLEERLTSRFQCGLVADIHPPDIETRIAILRQKAAREGIGIPDRVIFMLAESIRSNIRELEGALVRLSALASLANSPITEDLAKDALRGYLRIQASGPPDIVTIQRVVAKYFDVSVESIRGKRRTSHLALARQVAMYEAKQHTGMTLVEIGKRFGNRDHSTVIYALNRVAEELRRNEVLRRTISQVEAEITGAAGQPTVARATMPTIPDPIS